MCFYPLISQGNILNIKHNLFTCFFFIYIFVVFLKYFYIYTIHLPVSRIFNELYDQQCTFKKVIFEYNWNQYPSLKIKSLNTSCVYVRTQPSLSDVFYHMKEMMVGYYQICIREFLVTEVFRVH